MIKQVLGAWVLTAVAFALTAWFLPGVELEGGALGVLWVAALFGLINALLGTLLRLLTLPLIVATFGLFAVIVNTIVIGFTAWVSGDLHVDGFWSALWAAILISILTTMFSVLLRRGPSEL